MEDKGDDNTCADIVDVDTDVVERDIYSCFFYENKNLWGEEEGLNDLCVRETKSGMYWCWEKKEVGMLDLIAKWDWGRWRGQVDCLVAWDASGSLGMRMVAEETLLYAGILPNMVKRDCEEDWSDG